MHLRFAILFFVACLLAGCGGGGGSEPPPVPSSEPPADGGSGAGDTGNDSAGDDGSSAPFLLDATTRALIAPVVETSLSGDLIRCAVMLREDEACTFRELPLIGMQTAAPTVEDVMARVVVTHDWMGGRFRELLEAMPDEILLMARGLTGIVISSEIRPSFYTARTGAIYLDPQGMWLTPEEEAVISDTDDPRTEDIQQFRFLMLWRYVLPGNVDYRTPDRTVASLAVRTAALMFHELAHANDYYPPATLDSLNRDIPMFDNIATSRLPSTALSQQLPLTSGFMEELARAAFLGVPPTPAQLETSAAEVANIFPADVANDYYNYSTRREDLAMAFEEALMLYTLNVSRDVGVVEYPGSVNDCDELTVAWGQRTRIAESAVGARSVFAVERILPELAPAIEAMVARLPAPAQMTAGRGWCANILLGSGQFRALVAPTTVSVSERVQFLPIH